MARQWNAHRGKLSLANNQDDVQTPELFIDEMDAPEVHFESSLLEVLKSLSPEGFERLSQLVLREAGFSKVVVTGKSGDEGIDGHGTLEINELVSFRVLFQCKRYAGVVGSPAVREFRGAMTARTDKGIMITTGTFSRAAEDEAARPGAPPVELVDGERLVAMMQRLGIGVTPQTVYPVDHSFFETYRQAT